MLPDDAEHLRGAGCLRVSAWHPIIRNQEGIRMKNPNYIDADYEELDKGSKKNTSTAKQIVQNVLNYLLIFGVTVAVMTFVLNVNRIPSGSMEPTIKTNSIAISLRLPYLVGDPTPERGDIVTYREMGSRHRLLIKRVIGIPGDRITFEDGKVFVNGLELDEPYLLEQGSTQSAIPEFYVPDGHVFLMGDNRVNSNDSRFSGFPYIPVENVQARYLFIFGVKSLFAR